MKRTKFNKLLLSAFISSNLSLISPLSAAEENDPLKKMMSGVLSGVTDAMQEELSQRENLRGREDLARKFVSDFTNIMGNMMFGDGTNPLVMPILKGIKAQARFEFIIKKHPEVLNYTTYLNEFLIGIHDSKKIIKISALKLIDDELNGLIPSYSGFGTDYISPTSILRPIALPLIRTVIMQDLSIADELNSRFMKNTKYDYTKIDHIIHHFEYNLNSLKMTLKNFENFIQEKREIQPASKDLSLRVLTKESIH